MSVIVPTYNRAYCLCRAVDSALAQTHGNVEILLIDDGSTDGTAELVQTRYGAEPRVRYIFQKNAGVSEARNTAIRELRGDFAAFLDSDDYWYPWKLEAQLAAFRRLPEVGMVWTDMEAIDPEGRVTDPRYLRTMYHAYRRFRDEDLFDRRYPLDTLAPGLGKIAEDAYVFVGEIFSQMIVGNLVHTSTVLLRRERLDKVGFFNPDLKYAGEDFDYHLRTCREGPVAFINLASIQYQRGYADHLSREEHKVHLALNFLKAITPFLERDRARIQLPEKLLREVLAEAHNWVGEKALNAGDLPLARKHLWQSLCYDWRQPRNAALFVMSSLPFHAEARLRRAFRYCKERFGAHSQAT